MKEEHYLFALSFSVGHMTGMALVVADNEIRAFQLLKNSGRYNGTPEKYELIACRNLGISATCVPFELLFEEYTRADIVYKLFSDLVSNMRVEIGLPENFGPSEKRPLMDEGDSGTRGDSNKYAREDHVHPRDYTKVDSYEGRLYSPIAGGGGVYVTDEAHFPKKNEDVEEALYEAATYNYNGFSLCYPGMDSKTYGYAVSFFLPQEFPRDFEGADIELPITSGTLALKEDIEEHFDRPVFRNAMSVTNASSAVTSIQPGTIITGDGTNFYNLLVPSENGTIATKEYVDAAIAAAIHEALDS